MEHPAISESVPEAPSAWRLDEMRFLAQQQRVELHTIHQCMYGCRSLRPTTLCAVNAPALRHAIGLSPNRGLCDRSHRHMTLRGRDEEGRWRTTSSNQYPPQLCNMLARTVVTEILRKQPQVAITPSSEDEAWELPDELLCFVAPLDPYDSGIHMCRDIMWHRYS